jgi:hypothetical protein
MASTLLKNSLLTFIRSWQSRRAATQTIRNSCEEENVVWNGTLIGKLSCIT